MKSKLLTTLIAVMLVVVCLFTMTACRGFWDFIKGNDTDQTQDDNNNGGNNDNDGDDDDGGDGGNDDNDSIDGDDDSGDIVVYSLATDSWETIAQVSASGNASTTYAVGDEKTILLSTGESVTIVIYGFNHDDLTSGTGKAGITFGLKNVLTMPYKMTATAADGKWSTCLLRKDTMPKILAQLPAELKAVIKEVNKVTPLGVAASFGSETTADKLFIFSAKEIMNPTTYNPAGAQYEYWKSVKDGTRMEDRVMYLGGIGAATEWHFRLTYTASSTSWISATGSNPTGNSILTDRGVCFGFCV